MHSNSPSNDIQSPFLRADIRGFNALRFNQNIVSDITERIIPPGPGIARSNESGASSERTKDNYLFPPKEGEEPALPGISKEKGLRDLYRQWASKGELIQDHAPSVYIHELEFFDPSSGAVHKREGFLAILAINPQGKMRILPHEKTFPDRVQRQTNIFKWRGSLVLPLQMLYSDPNGDVLRLLKRAMDPDPILDFTDTLAHHNRLWRVDLSGLNTTLDQILGPKDLLIADGHHRFEAAKLYAKQHGNPDEALSLVFFSAAEAPGICLGTFHRGVRGAHLSPIDLVEKLSLNYRIEKVVLKEANPIEAISLILNQWLRERENKSWIPHSFIMIPKGCQVLYKVRASTTVKGNDRNSLDLDVTDLHENIIPLLGDIEYLDLEKDPQDLIDKLMTSSDDPEGLDMGFFLNPASTESLWDVARQGLTMPPKGTYFYPKLLAGLVHYPLDNH